MHEVGLCAALLDHTLRRADGRTVRSLRVRVSGHPVDPAVIEQNFRALAVGTTAAGAVVEVVFEPARSVCPECGAEAEAGELPLVACPGCGAFVDDWAGSEDAVLESITLAGGLHLSY